MFGKGNLANLMKQAQKMQEEMQRVQQEIVNMNILGQSGGGLVRVLMQGNYYVKKILLDDKLKEEDKSVVEELITAAFNDAVGKVEQETQGKMGKMAAGMELPEEFKFPSGSDDTQSE